MEIFSKPKQIYSFLIYVLIILLLVGCEKSSSFYTMLGTKYFRQKEYDKAINAYRKALESNYKSLELYNNLSVIYHYEKKDYEKAKQLYEEGLSFYPEAEGLLLGLMNVNLDLGNLDTALSQYEELAKKKRKLSLSIDANKIKDLMLQRSNTEEEIVATFERILKANPEDLMTNFNLGIYCLKQNKYNEAIKIYKKVIEIDPNLALAYSQLASAYSGIEDYANAKLYFKKAKKLGMDIPDDFFKNLNKKMSSE